MPQSSSNIVKGLVPTNPFLKGGANLATGGSTTTSFAPTNTTTSSVLPGGATSFNQPVPTGVNFGSLAKSSQPLASNGNTSFQSTGNSSRTAPSSSDAGAYTYNNGVNANGQTYPGFIPTTPFSQSVNGLVSLGSNPMEAYNENQNNAQNDQKALVGASGITPTEQNILNQENNLGKSFNVSNVDTTALEPGLTIGQVSGQQGALLNAYNTGLQNLQTQYGQAQGQQQLQQQGLNEAGGLANTGASNATSQQGTQQSALGAAGGLSQPVQVPYSNQYISPVNGEPVGGSTGNYSITSAAQQYAKMVQNGQMSYSDAVSALSGYGPAGQQALNSALPSGFNVNQSNATASSQSAQTQQVQQYKSASQQAKNLGLQLNQLLSAGGINPSDLNAANKAIQAIASNTSDPNYQTFQNLISDLANTYAQVLTPAGGSTTDMVRSISQNLLNSSMSGQGISQVMDNLDSQVQAKISGVTTAYGNGTNTNTNSGDSTANPWH